jgi:DNA invertase Pin-like site-specific DNA recombinase
VEVVAGAVVVACVVAGSVVRSVVVSRMQGGRRRRAAAGKHLGGRRPFGWQIDADGTLVLDAEEQRVLRRMRDMRGNGYAIRSVAAAAGLPYETTRRILLRG